MRQPFSFLIPSSLVSSKSLGSAINKETESQQQRLTSRVISAASHAKWFQLGAPSQAVHEYDKTVQQRWGGVSWLVLRLLLYLSIHLDESDPTQSIQTKHGNYLRRNLDHLYVE